ncbi:hypothetical protein [Phenylobacterium sp.]|uniref:hypothetical protein n=1 Tax=Phenylobacterium sp. TaxID=1871053 RepID=UPI0035AEBD2B
MAEQDESPAAGADEVRHHCGDLVDWKLNAILEAKPTVRDLAAAIAWASGQDEVGQEGAPLSGVAAEVYDILMSDEDFDETR